ncbi:MAG TPA: DUF554 domain-containing protein [Tissierellia bacterium]|nr:DUF554 domain-containing protein [Tissierellia bacterium]
MLGTIVNSAAIAIGSILGVLLNKGIKEEYRNTIMDGIALTVILIGIMGALNNDNLILMIISIELGSIIGEALEIEKKLDNLGASLENRFGKGDSNFSKGFVTASLVFCVGAMAIVGSLESGLQGNHSTLFAKSIIDGITSVIFASTLGIGVGFSSFAVLLYQGTITLLASSIKYLLTPEAINEMSSVGGLLIAAVGINILGIKKINVGNMLPAIFIPLIFFTLKGFLGF